MSPSFGSFCTVCPRVLFIVTRPRQMGVAKCPGMAYISNFFQLSIIQSVEMDK